MNKDIIIGGQSEHYLSLVSNCRSIIELVQQAVFVRTGISSTYCEVNQVTWDITICMGRETMKVNTCCRQLGPFLHSYILGVSSFITYYTLPEITTAAKTLIGELLNTTYRGNWNEFNRLLSPPPSRQWSEEELTSVGNFYERHEEKGDGEKMWFQNGDLFVLLDERADFLYIPKLWEHLAHELGGRDVKNFVRVLVDYKTEEVALVNSANNKTWLLPDATWREFFHRIEYQAILSIDGFRPGRSAITAACLSFEPAGVPESVLSFTGDGIVVNI